MSKLDIYNELGFKFILCKADKTPDIPGSDNWEDGYNHLTINQAKTYQKTGRMIGALIPPDIIVLDLERRNGSADGQISMNEIKKKYGIEYSVNETMVIMTPRGGHHLYYKLPRNFMPKKGKPVFTNGQKALGVELKCYAKNDGYVIAADSPGYKIFNEYITEIYPELVTWLKDCENGAETGKKESKKGKKKKDKSDELEIPEKKKLHPRTLKRILKKIETIGFTDKKRFEQFARSCVAVCGNSDEVRNILIEWIMPVCHSDGGKLNETVVKEFTGIVNGIQESEKITIGSFIHFLREENMSQYMINQVVKFDSVSNVLIDAENSEVDLPFCDPDYHLISQSPAAQEFFNVQGNTAGASILEMALENKVLYSDADKKPFYFDDNRWIEFNDYYGIVYTIIFRVVKIIYAESEADKDDNDRMLKCIRQINSTKWKQMTWTELCNKELVYRKSVEWDSPKIVETITTIDGVIDFTTGKAVERSGNYFEYRKSYFTYTTEEIMTAKKPEKFIEFFDSLFPDHETRYTAMHCVSMAISGNSGKRLFQLWQGIGSNGKSTLLETIRNVLGREKSYKFPAEILLTGAKKENYKAELAKFQGKYFCYSSEAEKGARLSQNIIKEMTGDEAIAARELYKSPIEFEATWQIIYAVNDLPAIYGDDYAFNDRLIVLPFKMFFFKDGDKKRMALGRGVSGEYMMKADNSKKFKQGLYEEKASIIKWMIDNYNSLNNDLDGVIPESSECKKKKSNYIEDNDDIGVFLSELCTIDESMEHGWYIPLEEIAEEFRNFTGSHKKGTKSIIRDIIESHVCIEHGVENVKPLSSSVNPEAKRIRVLRNVKFQEIDSQQQMNIKSDTKIDNFNDTIPV